MFLNPRHRLNFEIALKALLVNKGRSFLTTLGIIFGVAAVISMLAIGKGAQQEILDQMKLVGVNNIVITPVVEQKEELVEAIEKSDQKKYSPGLTISDASAILEVIPGIERISPEILVETNVVNAGLQRSAKLVGVEPSYFKMLNFEMDEGVLFSSHNLDFGDQVCIIGKGIQSKFFSKEHPLGKFIKCGNNWYKVTGILKERMVSGNPSYSKLGIRDNNMDVYVPLKTVLIRFKNRSLITKSMITRNAKSSDEEESKPKRDPNYHQLDKLVVQMKSTESLKSTADILSRLLKRRHFSVVDFEISIPELLLKQQERTKDIFNIVLGAIAAISLLVGGIGIMNIMLASVLERIKEIGIRLSLGATKKDIVSQFLIEATLLSVTGGIAGILLGLLLAFLVSELAGITTLISPVSVLVSFTVSVSVGLIFGIIPAKRAAELDPVQSLRYE